MSEPDLVEEKDGPAGRLSKGEWFAIFAMVVGVLVFALFMIDQGTTWFVSDSSAPAPVPAASSALPSAYPTTLSPSDGPCVFTVMNLLWQDLGYIKSYGPTGGLNNGQIAQQYGSDSKVWAAFTQGHETAVMDLQKYPLNTVQDMDAEHMGRLLPVVRKYCK